jgi:glycosyltransferase involved in cell wall biosynthesis
MKICTWGNVASALEGKTQGGGELQIALLAKALAKAGHEVVVVDLDAKNDFVTNDGIKVYQIKGYNDGVRVFRFFTQRLPKIYSSLKEQKADIYYCQIRDFRHLLAYWAARKTNGIFVIQLASDLDASNLRMKLKHDYLTHFGGLFWFLKVFMTELIFPFLLRKADMVLVQHEGQKSSLIKMGIKSIIFKNLFELNDIPQMESPLHQDFCYVGSLDKRKGFAQFFELAKKAPSISFKVIGQPRDRTAFKCYEELKSFKNVRLMGRLNHAETMGHIANSRALVSTSPMEGFPNIFIEAWACGIPVLSLSFDPGGTIKREKIGEVADGDIDKLIGYIESVKNSEEFARKARAYVEHNHVLNADKILEISCLFSDLFNNRELKI